MENWTKLDKVIDKPMPSYFGYCLGDEHMNMLRKWAVTTYGAKEIAKLHDEAVFEKVLKDGKIPVVCYGMRGREVPIILVDKEVLKKSVILQK